VTRKRPQPRAFLLVPIRNQRATQPPSVRVDNEPTESRQSAECHGNLSSAARRPAVSRGLLYRRLRTAAAPAAD
jgi:transcriptional regulator of acetoin/glycerol metabolism